MSAFTGRREFNQAAQDESTALPPLASHELFDSAVTSAARRWNHST